MKQTIKDYLTSPDPINPQHYRVLQRSVLQEYFKLLPESTTPIVEQIQQDAEQKKQDIQERFEQETRVAHLCHDPELQRLEREIQSQRQAIEAQCKQESARIHQQTQEQKKALEDKTLSQIDKMKKQFDEKRMVAEFVSGGTEEKCQKEARLLQDLVNHGKSNLAQLHEQAATCFPRLNLSLETPAVPLESISDGEHLENQFKESQANAERSLNAISSSKSAVLFLGWRLWACLLGLLIIGEIIAVFVSVLSLIDISLLLLCLLTAAGVLGVGGPLFGLIGWSCRRQLLRHQTDFNDSYHQAQQSLKQYDQWKRQQLSQWLQDAKNKQTQEIKQAHKELTHNKNTIQSQFEQALQELNHKLHQAELQLQQRQSKALSQAQQRHQEQYDKVKRQCDQELDDIEQRRRRDLTVVETQEKELREQLEHCWDQAIEQLRTLYEQTRSLAPKYFLPLHDISPDEWEIPAVSADIVEFGSFPLDLRHLHADVMDRGKETLSQLPDQIHLPALLGLPEQGSLLLQSDRLGREKALDTLRAVVARLFTVMAPGKVRFTLVDPVGLGETFAGFMHAGDYQESLVGGRIWTEQAHIQQQLEDLTAHMETVIQKYLRNEFETIEDYNEQAGELAEPYRYLVIADFPIQFNEEAARRLTSILQSGPRCGVHTLIAYDTRQNLPQGFDLEDICKSSIHLIHQEKGFVWQDSVYKHFDLELEQPLSERKLTELMHLVGQAGINASRVEVPFTSIAPSSEKIWSQDSRRELTVAIGRTGATRRQYLALGKGMSQHMLIAGKTGSGKSTLFHALVTNMALWYSPDEVEMYLIDFKKGVEFKTYVTHQVPHIRAVAIESDREFGISILERLDAELTRRGELFRQVGVQDIAAYRDQTGKSMPRTLLIVDEFQVFFADDDKLAQDAAILLEQLVRQGRAFGVHVILGSQTLGGAFGLARSTMGQMAIRLALQCSETDSQLILDDDNIAARNLNRPGEAIYNDAGGQIAGNSPFQVAWLPDQVRDEYLDKLPRPEAQPREAMIVFEGSQAADIRDNQALSKLLQTDPEPQWSGPPTLWFGAPLAIKAPTSVTLRRQSGANILIVGQRDDMAMHLMSSAWVSLAAQYPQTQARFYALDGCPSDSPLAGYLSSLATWTPQATTLVPWRQVEETLVSLVEEVRQRLNDDSSHQESIFLFIYGLQRYRMLRRSEDGFGFSLDNEGPASADANLSEILREGPAVGVHVLTWADTLATLERTMDRSTLREFDHRILMQMSANDSSNLIDSTAANQLGFHRGLLYSEEQGGVEKFRPYAIIDIDWLNRMASHE